MTNTALTIVTQEKDEATLALSVLDIFSEDITDFKTADDETKKAIRKKVMGSIEHYVDMILDGSADYLTIEKHVQ